MDSLHPQLDDLTTQIDTLTTTLQPLLTTPLTTSTTKLPLLDKAKLYVLTTYTLESLLFTSLRLCGTDAKNHAVFAELKRVREYFGKIAAAEEMGAGGGSVRARLDKQAAGRFIKAGLSGNERYDAERREREGRERAGAKRKLEAMGAVGTHTRFEGAAKRVKGEEETVGVVKAEDVMDEEDNDESSFNEAADQTVEKSGKRKTKGKKGKMDQQDAGDAMASLEASLVEPEPVESSAPASEEGKSGKKNKNKKRKSGQ